MSACLACNDEGEWWIECAGLPVACTACGGVDRYGNPLNSERLIYYCCFPDCGCDGARLCMAENGASNCSLILNIEHGSPAARGDTP
jgi:hypothetical protein